MLQTRKVYGRRGDPRDTRESLQEIANHEQRPVALIDIDTKKVLRRVRPEYRYIDDIKKRNKARGDHWFSPGNMRFFSSRVQSSIYVAKDGRAYFVSSERSPNDRRAYSVRVAELDGSINTVGDFQAYKTGRAAHAAARKAAQS